MSNTSQQQAIIDYFHHEAPVLFLVLSQGGVVQATNAYTGKLLGASIVGREFAGLLADSSADGFSLERALAGYPAGCLLNVQIPGALARSFSFTFRRDNEAVLAFGKSDEEELELLQSELLAANQELHETSRELHKKKAQLEHLNKVKNQFLGMAAHDLRKPLTVISLYAEFMLAEGRKTLDTEQKDYLDRIVASAGSMKHLIDDFLDVSAIEAGNFTLHHAMVDVAAVLEKSLILPRLMADKRDIRLDVAVTKGIPEISADGGKIEQAMSNLLVNAVEHSPQGGSVFVKLEEAGDWIIFSVRDQGDGIDEETMSRLFLPFSRAKTAKRAGDRSMGLGLAITRKIIEAHQGEIKAESREGAGTVFTVLLPKTSR